MNPKKLLMTEQGMQQLAAERIAKIQAHLDEMNKVLTAKNIAREFVLRAELQRVGVPKTEAEQNELLARCIEMADRISSFQNMEKYNGLKQLITDLKVGSVPEHLTWIAKQCGVELVKQNESTLLVEGSH